MKVGILGAGQLARMLAESGVPAGMRFVFLDPKDDPSAAALGEHLAAQWTDPAALDRLAECDFVTCDFENVPAEALDALGERTKVRPSASALAASQDRLEEKNRFRELGLDTPRYRAIDGRTDLAEAAEALGFPFVVKTRRLGYDGKGQRLIRSHEDLEPAWQALGDHALIAEEWVDFDHECAITAVRSASGELRCWPLTRTVHGGGILRLAMAPEPNAGRLQDAAEDCVRRLAEDLDYIGCLTLELFAVGDRLLLNEFAPRVHNSAHWTIEGSTCSQFANHLRAVCDLPLGDADVRGAALMVNFIGELPDARPWLEVPGASWHDYGKQGRPGRKLGHATIAAAGVIELAQRFSAIRALLEPDDAQALDSIAADCRGSNSTR
ncbi:MAG: 5-(carboxyamino)imidazole ribonucleotide synthase [Wenzhouxiangellaceae bacterium]|nr:5-(carboxyamino)imidazole ribonucleotide synthase [Wenzhouxiangellaceae bacterium]